MPAKSKMMSPAKTANAASGVMSLRLFVHLSAEHCVKLRAASILAAPLVSFNASLDGRPDVDRHGDETSGRLFRQSWNSVLPSWTVRVRMPKSWGNHRL